MISLKLGGRLDFETTAKLEGPVLLRAASKKSGVVMDLSRVEFIGSTGLRLLLKCAKGQHALGGKVVLCSPNPLVREVLMVAGMPNAIPLYDSFEEACDHAKAVASTEPWGGLPPQIIGGSSLGTGPSAPGLENSASASLSP